MVLYPAWRPFPSQPKATSLSLSYLEPKALTTFCSTQNITTEVCFDITFVYRTSPEEHTYPEPRLETPEYLLTRMTPYLHFARIHSRVGKKSRDLTSAQNPHVYGEAFVLMPGTTAETETYTQGVSLSLVVSEANKTTKSSATYRTL